MSVSIIILTLNEEINVEACIDTVSWSDDIVVFDSVSTDRTKEIAIHKGARIIEREFDNWSNHQNWALENIEFKYPWVFYIDADERCTEKLAKEIIYFAQKDSDFSAYRIKRRDYFMGKWLRHAQLYPTWLVRLFRPDKIRFERLVNPVPKVDGLIGELSQDIIHHPFSHGISHWIDRHNKYSEMEALENCRLLKSRDNLFSGFLSGDPNIKRSALKNVFYRMPARPLIKFIYYYIFRMGFLDGRSGFTYCLLQAFYEYMIVIKKNELLRKEKGLQT